MVKFFALGIFLFAILGAGGGLGVVNQQISTPPTTPEEFAAWVKEADYDKDVINTVFRNGWTPTHLAVLWNSIILPELLESGANIYAPLGKNEIIEDISDEEERLKAVIPDEVKPQKLRAKSRVKQSIHRIHRQATITHDSGSSVDNPLDTPKRMKAGKTKSNENQRSKIRRSKCSTNPRRHRSVPVIGGLEEGRILTPVNSEEFKASEGYTPLHLAAQIDNRQAVRYLLNLSSIGESHPIQWRDARGNTPLHIAIKYRNWDLLGELLEGPLESLQKMPYMFHLQEALNIRNEEGLAPAFAVINVIEELRKLRKPLILEAAKADVERSLLSILSVDKRNLCNQEGKTLINKAYKFEMLKVYARLMSYGYTRTNPESIEQLASEHLRRRGRDFEEYVNMQLPFMSIKHALSTFLLHEGAIGPNVDRTWVRDELILSGLQAGQRRKNKGLRRRFERLLTPPPPEDDPH